MTLVFILSLILPGEFDPFRSPGCVDGTVTRDEGGDEGRQITQSHLSSREMTVYLRKVGNTILH